VAEVAGHCLARDGAVDAVVAGVLAAGAWTPSVLLGPVQLLIGGSGAGLLAVDGRLRQPGAGVARPRGFLATEEVVGAAYVAVPTLPAALAAVVASRASGPLHRACAPAIALAKTRSGERAAVLEEFARRGAPAMAGHFIATELLAVAGRAARGLLTLDDLSSLVPRVVGCDPRPLEPSGILVVPWLDEASSPSGATTQIVAATDARGVVAIACYETPLDGISIPALGLVAPRSAEPVMRGRPRVPPGDARPAASPIALRALSGSVDLALGIATCSDSVTALRSLVEAVLSAPTLAQAFAAIPAGRPVAIARSAEAARAFVG
jgi:gamma-glutamyltranspeptidase/glutathione hydrolase